MRFTRQDFISKAREIHGSRYDYSKVVYRGLRKVTIICPVDGHGEWEQSPHKHMRGQGCPKCQYDLKRLGADKFIERARQIYGDYFDYSGVVYRNNATRVNITCPKCGVVEIYPKHHLDGQGCPRCGKAKLRKSHEQFVQQAKVVHGEKYDYSITNYEYSHRRVRIWCISGQHEFSQKPATHLAGYGCNICSSNEYINAELAKSFVQRAQEIHGKGRYDYSQAVYEKRKQKVLIRCTVKDHGGFLQTPDKHLAGQGCPKCSESWGHRYIRNTLTRAGVAFEEEWWHPDCKDQYPLPFDFFVAGKLLVEYDGEHHFGLGQFAHEYVQRHDGIKNHWAETVGIPFVRIPYTDFEAIPLIIAESLRKVVVLE